ncbi:class I SAM-dependent methyltransferase [Halobacillus sp. H74]|uniref:class I SAM-dependent methyltransferase n=1 Tax=Halobacillus sp. H74 TaxID=3457436 RepID=UPI003FCDEE56
MSKIDVFNEKMKSQINMSWAQEEKVLDLLNVEDGKSVLEIGCGPGFVTEKLLNKYPNSTFTATDYSQQTINHANEYLMVDTNNRLSLIQDDILNSNLPEGKYDLAIARYVFQHLNDPSLAIHNITKLLKSGGQLIIIDVDDDMWGMLEPSIQEVKNLLKKFGNDQKAGGGNRLIGRDLWKLMDDGGYIDVNYLALPITSHQIGLQAFTKLLDTNQIRMLYSYGMLSKDEAIKIIDSFKDFFSSDDSYAMSLLFISSGFKE